ncbi:MAG: hypothetical protein ACRCX2_07015 [Paraclostridium sp.]
MSGKFVKVMKNYKGEEITSTGIFANDELISVLVNEKFSDVEAREIAQNYLDTEFMKEDGYNFEITYGNKKYVNLIPREGCKFTCKSELVWEFEFEEKF